MCHNPPRLGRRRRGRRTSAPVRRPPEPGSHRYRSWINERSTLNLLYQRSTLNGRSRHTARVSLDGFALCICALAFAGRSLHTLTTSTRSARNTGSASGYGGWGAYPLPRGDANRSGFRQARIGHRANGRIPPPGGPTADRTYTAGHPPRPAGNKLLKGQAETFKRTPRGSAGLGAGGHRSILHT